jgi:predicted aspartyl protease
MHRPIGQLLTRRLILALLPIVSSAFGEYAAAADEQTAAAADELLRCQYVEEELICTKVKVFGEEALFVIDTGASMTILDRRFENRLGKRRDDARPVQTPTGIISMASYDSPVMKIVTGDTEMDLSVAAVGIADLRIFLTATDQPIAGFIGMDFLKKHVLRVNIDEGYAALVHAPRDTPAEMKHISFDKLNLPTVRLRISDDQFHEFPLDTGNCNQCLSLGLPLFRKLKQKGRIIADGGSVVVGAAGFANAQPGFLDHAEMGNIVLRNVVVSSGQLNLIGLQFLERFEVEFDFPNRKAYFRPGKRLQNPPRKNLSHFGVKIVDDKLVVIGCRGIAEDAGIRVDDVLVRINGRPAREMTISAFRRLQCIDDTKLNLQFERLGESFDISLKLKQPPNPFPDHVDNSAETPSK